jgi:hypothetical protein
VAATLSTWRSWVYIPIQGADGKVGNRQTTSAQTRGCCGFNSHPCYRDVSAGHWRAQMAVTHPSQTVQVQLLLDTLADSALTRSCSWESSRSPKPAEWVRLLPTLLIVPVGQPGVAASLSRRRSGVQISSGTLLIRAVSREARDPSDTRGDAGSIPAGPNEQSRGAAWSARHPDMVEIAGSNPAGTTDSRKKVKGKR